MNTKILNASQIDIAAQIINNGGLVAIPTETVYGLAANAFDSNAVSKIFKAKGRPSDNPLIVHISDINEIYRLVLDFPKKAQDLAFKFWPGPITIILKKSDVIPNVVSGNLDTVAIRMPDNDLTRKLIKISGKPLAAPSANLSGSPSPTTMKHVLDDLNGKIDAIIDGGNCKVGLESTVITLASEKPRILRPGGITKEQIESVIGDIEIDKGVLSKIDDDKKVISPGMKYKHYSPNAKVIIIKSDKQNYINYVNNKLTNNSIALCYNEDMEYIKGKSISYGNESDSESQARQLFNSLRLIDKMEEINLVYARCPVLDGVGLAVYNRLIRAAGFEVVSIDENNRFNR